MFGAVVHDDIHNHAAARPRARTRSVNLFSLDQAPLAARTPVPVEIIEGIFGVLRGMLLPIGIMHPDAVRCVVILPLQRLEEMSDNALLRPITEPPSQKAQNNNNQYRGNDSIPPSPGFLGIVLLRVQQRHVSSITDTGERGKVPDGARTFCNFVIW